MSIVGNQLVPITKGQSAILPPSFFINSPDTQEEIEAIGYFDALVDKSVPIGNRPLQPGMYLHVGFEEDCIVYVVQWDSVGDTYSVVQCDMGTTSHIEPPSEDAVFYGDDAIVYDGEQVIYT